MSLEKHEDHSFLTLSSVPLRRPQPSAWDIESVFSVVMAQCCCISIILGVICLFMYTTRGLQFDDILGVLFTQFFLAGVLATILTGYSQLSHKVTSVRELKLFKRNGCLFGSSSVAYDRRNNVYDLSLSDIRFFHRLTINNGGRNPDSDEITDMNSAYGIEIVSLQSPLFVGCFLDPVDCTAAVNRLNSLLSDWRNQQRDLACPVSIISRDWPHVTRRVIVAQETDLVKEPPIKSQIHFVYGRNDALVCLRRRTFPVVWVVCFLFGLCLFLISAYGHNIRLHDEMPPPTIFNRSFLCGILAWTLPILLTLIMWSKGDRWIFRPHRAKSLYRYEIFGKECDLSKASTIEVWAADVLTSQDIRQKSLNAADFVGGERFGVRFLSASHNVLWSMDRILEREALFVARELRRKYPQLCRPT